MLPHQGVVALTVSGLSLIITLGLLFAIQRREKKFQKANQKDEH